MTVTSYDCLVIGAGMAGISAARWLKTRPELRFCVLEARGRIGGRVWSLHDFASLPLELGAEWLHAADENPLVAVFESVGHPVRRENPGWGVAAVREVLSAREAEACADALAAGEAAVQAAGRVDPDGSLANCLSAALPYHGLFAAQLTFLAGGDPADVSVHDFAAFRDTGSDWSLEQGLGAGLAAMARGLPIQLGVRVLGVDFAREVCVVRTDQGEVAARTVIMTLPVGVLQSGGVLLPTALPETHREALAGLAPGAAEKFFIHLRRSTLGLAPGTALMSRSDQAECAYLRLLRTDAPVLAGLIAGSLAQGLSREGEAAVLAYAHDELVHLFGSSVRRELGTGRASNWLQDPDTLGAYSYARPGASEARQVLASPVMERLWFAGEACDRHGAGALHGAFRSGEQAAKAVLASLGYAQKPRDE